MTTGVLNRPTLGDWKARAACRDAPDKSIFDIDAASYLITDQLRQAKRYCRQCPVQTECLTDFINWGDSGQVRGGQEFRRQAEWATCRTCRRRFAREAVGANSRKHCRVCFSLRRRPDDH